MPGKFVINLTCSKNDTDKATVAFVVAVGLWAKRRISQRQSQPMELNLKVS